MGHQKSHSFPLNDTCSVFSLHVVKETYIVLESPFHATLNGLIQTPYIEYQ